MYFVSHMNCHFCGHEDTQVVESRVVDEGKTVRRRRACSKCSKRFTTYERTRQSVLWVVKKDGTREPFDKEKIRRGVLRAIEKRPVALGWVNDMLDKVEQEMLRKESEEVSTKLIGRSVLTKLKSADKVAWLRFASVYLEFEDLKDFEKTIEKI